MDEDEKILFVIFKTKTNYLIQTVRGKDGKDRKKLPKAWMGKRDEELVKVTGVSDSVFCHTGRFIAAAGSLEGIKKLAQIAIKEPYEYENERADKEKDSQTIDLDKFIDDVADENGLYDDEVGE